MTKKTNCGHDSDHGGNRKPHALGNREGGKTPSRGVIAVGVLRSTGRWFVVPKR